MKKPRPQKRRRLSNVSIATTMTEASTSMSMSSCTLIVDDFSMKSGATYGGMDFDSTELLPHGTSCTSCYRNLEGKSGHSIVCPRYVQPGFLLFLSADLAVQTHTRVTPNQPPIQSLCHSILKKHVHSHPTYSTDVTQQVAQYVHVPVHQAPNPCHQHQRSATPTVRQERQLLPP